jgi:hypothetical protein
VCHAAFGAKICSANVAHSSKVVVVGYEKARERALARELA